VECNDVLGLDPYWHLVVVIGHYTFENSAFWKYWAQFLHVRALLEYGSSADQDVVH
jgi:hypothetical protein